MSFASYMNMEKLSLDIAEKHIRQMTNKNYDEEGFLTDISGLTNNIENGFVAITQLVCFFESFLNTILNTCMDYQGETLLKCSKKKKLEIIFMHYQKDLKIVRGQNPWEIYRTTTKVRNAMIHYKKTFLGEGIAIPDFKFGKQEVGKFFTKDNMESVWKGYIELAALIADTLGLSIYHEIGIFECDGRDALVNYVYDSSKVHPDPSRFL